jgi:hypothetical protein
LVRAIVDDGLDDAGCWVLGGGGVVEWMSVMRRKASGRAALIWAEAGGAAAWINSSCFGASEGQLRSWKASVCRSQN